MIRRSTRSDGAAPPPRPFHRVLRADPLSVRRVLGELRRIMAAHCPDEALGRLELVLAEVLNNIVEHGTGRDAGCPRGRIVHLLVRPEAECMRCVVTDTGVRLPCECLSPRRLPGNASDLPEDGFGWWLIQHLVRDLSYSRNAGRNFLAFTLPAKAAVAA